MAYILAPLLELALAEGVVLEVVAVLVADPDDLEDVEDILLDFIVAVETCTLPCVAG